MTDKSENTTKPNRRIEYDDDGVRITAKSRQMLGILADGFGIPPDEVERHVTQLPDDSFYLDIHREGMFSEEDMIPMEAYEERGKRRALLHSAVRDEIDKLQTKRDGIDQAIEALKIHVLDEGPGSIPF